MIASKDSRQGLQRHTYARLWPWYILPFAVTFLHVALSPYTKVEESFSLHAVHDFLRYGLSPSALSKFDHVEFPGAVPRSFLPSLLLAVLSYPFAALAVSVKLAKTSLHIQIIVRLVLAVVFSLSLNHLAGAAARRFGYTSGVALLILFMSQFHVPYYASRTLPNFLALPPVLYSLSLLVDTAPRQELKRSLTSSIAILTFTAAVMRLELAVFVVPLALNLVARGRLSFIEGLVAGAAGGFSGLACSVPLDSYLWSYWVWPEASGVFFNVYQCKAAEWGVMPPLYYLTSGLPKVLTFAMPLTIMGALVPTVRRTGLFSLLLPSMVGMIGGMSLIGHKEWRFVVYVVPAFNVIAAVTVAHLWTLPTTIRTRVLIRLAILGGLAANITGTCLMTYASSCNYPGGEVEAVLGKHISNQATPRIHFSAAPLMTGASLFTFTHARPAGPKSRWLPSAFPEPLTPSWEYFKTENKGLATPQGAWDEDYHYVVTESWDEYEMDGLWRTVERIPTFHRFSWRPAPSLVLAPAFGVVTRISREAEV